MYYLREKANALLTAEYSVTFCVLAFCSLVDSYGL